MGKMVLGLAALLSVGLATTANAVTYLYEIDASYVSQPAGPTNSIVGSFTLDDTIGAASISNVDIRVTLPLSGGPFSFAFDQVINPAAAWDVGLIWFANDAFAAGDTHFFAFFRPDTILNDGSYIIGQKLSDGSRTSRQHQSWVHPDLEQI